MLGSLTSAGIRSRLGLFGGTSRSMLHSADIALRRELKSVRTGEIALSSFTFGLIQGRCKAQGGLTLGLPVDLLAGATFHALALLGGRFTRDYAHHLHAFGDGALASFLTTTGYRVGERWAAGTGLVKSLGGMFGDVGKEPAGGAAIADKELVNLVRG